MSNHGWSRALPLWGMAAALVFVGVWAAVTRDRGEGFRLPAILGLIATSAVVWGAYRATTYETVSIDIASDTVTWRTYRWSRASIAKFPLSKPQSFGA